MNNEYCMYYNYMKAEQKKALNVTFHFVLFKIPSFARVIGFSFIPNIRTIDNKLEEKCEKSHKAFFCSALQLLVITLATGLSCHASV